MQSEQSSSSRLEACLTKCNRFFVPTRYPPRHLVSIVYILLDIPIFTHCRILSVPISTTEVVVGTRIQRYYFVISANFSYASLDQSMPCNAASRVEDRIR